MSPLYSTYGLQETPMRMNDGIIIIIPCTNKHTNSETKQNKQNFCKSVNLHTGRTLQKFRNLKSAQFLFVGM